MTKIIESAPGMCNGFKNINILNSWLWGDMVHDMNKNNTYCPDIDRIIYNIGTKAYPQLDDNGKRVKDKDGKVIMKQPVKVLTTVVFFCDGTKVSVTNSEHDGIQFEDAVKEVEKIDENGKKYTVKEPRGFQVATKASKEAGLVYAVVKRMVGIPDKKGTVQGNGFGRILNALVDEAYDTVVEEHDRKEANAKAKAEYDAKKGTSKKAPRPSLAASVDRMTSLLDKLAAKLG